MGEKKLLKKNLEKLDKDEYIEIFKMINAETDKYTINSNGIFINLSSLSDELVRKLVEKVEFFLENRKNKPIAEDYPLDSLQSDAEVNGIKVSIVKAEPDKLPDYDDEPGIDGSKITLKKVKPKYTGVKAKLIRGGGCSGGNTSAGNATVGTNPNQIAGGNKKENVYRLEETDKIEVDAE